MNTSLATRDSMTVEQVDLVKRTIAKGLTDDELALFLYQCQRTGLDPFSKQIHPVKRWDSKTEREVLTIQTGIDGYRLIAERTGCYAPGREPTYTHDADGHLVTATAYVKKIVKDTWHEVAATAWFDEFKQTYYDKKNKTWKLTSFWQRMPHNQLAKCAEALALRRAFPLDLSGIYTDEEIPADQMTDAEVVVQGTSPAALPAPVENPKHRQSPPEQADDTPASGAALLEKLNWIEGEMVKRGWCKPGDLLRFLEPKAQTMGYPERMEEWGRPAVIWAMAEARAFKDRARRKVAGPEAPKLARAEQAVQIRELAGQLNMSGDELADELGPHGAAAPEQLTEKAADETLARMRALLETENSAAAPLF